jgi:large subunit ribosomal protein L25
MLELSVQLRPVTGRQNEKIRKQGLIPAILYGHKVKNLALTVETQQFNKVYKEAGESTLVRLKIDGGQKDKESIEKDSLKKGKDSSEKGPGRKERVVLIYEIAKDPVSGNPIHVDFYQVKMDEPITTEVPLVFVGESPAVKELDGVLVKNIQSLEIEALPADLPHQLEIDVSSLKTFDDNIYIKDLKLPAGVKTEAQPDEVIASVIPPRTKAELEELEKAPEEKIEEVEIAEREKAGEEVKEEVKEESEEKATEPSEKESAKEGKSKGGNE